MLRKGDIMNLKILLILLTIIMAGFINWYTKPDSVEKETVEKEVVKKEVVSKVTPLDVPVIHTNSIIEKEKIIHTRETTSVTLGSIPVPNVTVSNSAKGDLLTDNAVSLGDISRVNGNIEIVSTDNSESIGKYDTSNHSISSSSIGMSTEDVDVLLNTAKRDIGDTLNRVVKEAKTKIGEDIVTVKIDLTKYISLKTEESLKLSTEFTDKHLDMKEKTILANMDSKNDIIKSMVQDKVATINQTIINNTSDNTLQLDHLKKNVADSDKLLEDSIQKSSKSIQLGLDKTDTALTALDAKLANSVTDTIRKIDNVLLALNKAESNITNNVNLINNDLQIKIATLKKLTDTNITRATDMLNVTIANKTYDITRSIENNTTSLTNKITELNTYVDNKLEESIALMGNLVSRSDIDARLETMYTRDVIDAKLLEVSSLISGSVTRDVLDAAISDVNASIEVKTKRTLEVFWYYGDNCPINSVPLDGGNVDYSVLATVFENGDTPDYRGRFIRSKTETSYIGSLEEDSTSPKGLYITSTNAQSIGVSNDIGEEDGTEYHWIQGGYGLPTQGYYVEPNSILNISSHEAETRPKNVTLNLCMHE